MSQPNPLTTVHCVMFPLFVLSASDGDLADEEMKDIFMTANTLPDIFNDVTKESAQNAAKECAEWYDSMSAKEALNVACWCCGEIHKDLNETNRENIVRFYDDQIKADGKVTEIELSLHKVFSMIIRKGLGD